MRWAVPELFDPTARRAGYTCNLPQVQGSLEQAHSPDDDAHRISNQPNPDACANSGRGPTGVPPATAPGGNMAHDLHEVGLRVKELLADSIRNRPPTGSQKAEGVGHLLVRSSTASGPRNEAWAPRVPGNRRATHQPAPGQTNLLRKALFFLFFFSLPGIHPVPVRRTAFDEALDKSRRTWAARRNFCSWSGFRTNDGVAPTARWRPEAVEPPPLDLAHDHRRKGHPSTRAEFRPRFPVFSAPLPPAARSVPGPVLRRSGRPPMG